MRILCITTHSDRPEAETFIALHNLGVKTTVLCPSSAPHFELLKTSGIDLIEFDLNGRIDLKGISFIRHLLKNRKYDILHMFNNKAVSNGVIASYGLKHKMIAYRGIVANVSYFDPASWMTYLNPKIDIIICVANAIRDYFHQMKCLWHRFPAQKAVTIYKGHKLSWYQEKPASLSEFGISDNSFVIGCTANNRPRKGINYLIESMTYLAEYQNIHLLLIGHMQSNQLIKLIEQNPARERIHLTGFRKDAPQIIAACQTAVLPAIKREGLPKVIIEAMAYKVPPVVTDSGGSPELIIDNESGLIVPVKDSAAIASAILKLYKNEDFRLKMGISAQQRIDLCFNHKDTVEKTLALYNRLLDS